MELFAGDLFLGEIEGFSGALMLTAILSAPFLGVMMIVGLMISILQAATQIQEQTVTFVPKLGVFAALTYFCGRWILGQLEAYLSYVLDSIPALSRTIGG